VLDTGRERRARLLLGPHRVLLVGLGVVLEARLEQHARAVLAARRCRPVLPHRRRPCSPGGPHPRIQLDNYQLSLTDPRDSIVL